MPICAESTAQTESGTGIREAIVQYIALGTPNDLIRLRDAFYRTERELAALQLEVPSEGSEQFAEKRQQMQELQHRLAEAEVIFHHLDRDTEERQSRRDDRISTDEQSALRSELLDRITMLQETIVVLQQEIRAEQADYYRILLDEQQGLSDLLTARRLALFAEYARFPDCQPADSSCLPNRLRVLCDLTLLVSEAERLPLLRLITAMDGSTQCSRTD
jgi:hypothetical protein